MRKGMVIIDMPEICQHKRGNPEHGCCFGGATCRITHEDVSQHVRDGTKPEWCPVREIKTQEEK